MISFFVMRFLSIETNSTVIKGLRVVTMIAPFPAKPRCAPLKNAILYMKNNYAKETQSFTSKNL